MNSKNIFLDLFQRMEAFLADDEDDREMESVFQQYLVGIEIGKFLASWFSYFGASWSGVLLMFPSLIQRTTFRDILEASRLLEDEFNPLYAFVISMRSIFGIDFHRLTNLQDGISVRTIEFVRNEFRPGIHSGSDHEAQRLAEIGINQADLIEKMRSQGAPIID